MDFDPVTDDVCPFCGKNDLYADVYVDEEENHWDIVRCPQCGKTLYDEKEECSP